MSSYPSTQPLENRTLLFDYKGLSVGIPFFWGEANTYTGAKMPVIIESAYVLKPDFDFAAFFGIHNFGFCNIAQSA